MTIGDEHDGPAIPPGPLLELPTRILFRIVGTFLSTFAILRAGVQPFVDSFLHAAYKNDPNQLLTPNEAAIAVVKGVLETGPAMAEARMGGIDSDRFDAIVKLTGNPPGPQELLDQWRRGLITKETLEHGLRQGYLKNEWIPFMEAFRHVPLPSHSYLQGAVEGHIGLDEAIRKVDGLGIDEADARLVYETLGNPPGIVEMLHLWKRGFVTEAEVDQAIRESHYKNKYVDVIKHYADYFPPPRTITTLLAHGAFTEAQADKYFQAAGLTPELSRAYIASALHVKTASHKELTVTQVQKLYVDHLISKEAALADLARVGYAGPEANLLIDLADAQQKAKVRQEAINGVKAVFMAHRIDEATVQADLAKFGIEPAQVAGLLELWKLLRLTPSKSLTIGQLNQAVKKAIIDDATFLDRAVQLGYTLADAQVLLAIDIGAADHPNP